MSKYLVIVESPTKARTLSSILGNEYDVTSSMGHIVDLPTSTLSIDIEGGFIPSYRIIPGREKTARLLKKKAKDKEVVYLATDPDREGEAISWHIRNQLSRNAKKFCRVTFHEITRSAIIEAFQHPAELDMQKVDAQKVRRILDRIVGYFLSPLLWKKIVRGLSAGRVQSVALKFIVERERQIKSFILTITYEVEAQCKAKGAEFKAKLKKYNNKKAVFNTKEEAKKVVHQLSSREFTVYDVRTRKLMRRPPPPHTTSLLQQEAFNKLHFSSKRTMIIAQKLYEGVTINGQMLGLITYMRTDSFRIADRAKKDIKSFIGENLGKDYVCTKEYKYKEKKSAQLAHEAIRPTDVRNTPERMKEYLKHDEFRLYELIWKRSVAYFMKEAVFEISHVLIGDQATHFDAEAKRIVFDGFLKITGAEEEKLLPSFVKGDPVLLEKIKALEKSTKPPARFNDASLVKILEEKGIGRPSTYAPTISTLTLRDYIRREKGYFKPTDLGTEVCEFLVNNFSEIMDENFTAQIEEKLDGIEEGNVDGRKVLEEFYPSFRKKVDTTAKDVKKRIELVDKKCPQCGLQLAVKWSRRGRFLSCSGYPQCKYAESITTGVGCPGCTEGQLIERRNKRGQFFYGCSKFPKCRYTSRSLPEDTAEDKGEKTEDKGQKTEDKGQKTENG